MKSLPLPHVIIIILLMFTAQVQAAQTVTAKGAAALENLTPAEARQLALKRARSSAVEKVCGVSVQAETYVQNYKLLSDFIHAVSYGQITSEKIIKWEAEVKQDAPDMPPQIFFNVTLSATVRKETGQRDPGFRVLCRLNKTVYQSGDEMIMTLKTTKPCYITILNFCADGSVVLLFPNRIRKENHLEALKEYQIPAESDRADVLKLQVTNLPDHKKDIEYIKVIATREKLYLLDGLFLQGNYGTMSDLKSAATEIARLISTIPPDKRAEHTVSYEIVASDP